MASGSQTLLALAARTTAQNIEFNNSGNYRGLIMTVTATAETDTAEVTPSIQVRDGNNSWVSIWTAAAAVSAVGTTTYLLYPGASGGNFTEVDGIPLPIDGRFNFAVADADSLTYTVVLQWLK